MAESNETRLTISEIAEYLNRYGPSGLCDINTHEIITKEYIEEESQFAPYFKEFQEIVRHWIKRNIDVGCMVSGACAGQLGLVRNIMAAYEAKELEENLKL